MDLLEELKKLAAKLHSEGIEYALCGGLAMAIYAMPRATLDIDIMVEFGTLFRTKRAVEELGFSLSGAPMEFHDGKIQIYRLCKVEARSGEELVLDLLIVTPETRQAWEGVCRVPFRTLGLCLRALGVIEDQGQAAIGNLAKKRAADLARPSYVIFEHYAKHYTAINPDDPISLAIVATGLVAADIAEELTEIIVVSRAIAKRERGGATDGSSETRRPADGPQTGRQT